MTDSLQTLAKNHFDLTLTGGMLAAFSTYTGELIAWSQRMNLTGITDPAEIQVKHFLDSLSILSLPDLPDTARVIDVGSGAGLPGLALKIARPGWQMTLLEATAKKAAFLDHMTNSLGLKNVTILNMRAEDAGQNAPYRAAYDLVMARAVARLPVLVEYMLPLCRTGGFCVAMKGETAHTETDDAAKAIHLLGGEVKNIHPVLLPGIDEKRWLVCIGKTGETPSKYPRRTGIPSRRPLS